MRIAKSALLAGGLCLWFVGVGCAPLPFEPDPNDSRGEDMVLAEVGNRTITSAELERRVLERFYGPRALLGLVREALFLAEAERLGVEVTPAELATRVEQELSAVLGESLEERRQSVERLRWQGLEVEDLRRELEVELSNLLLIQKVISSHRSVSEEDVRVAFEQSWNRDRRRVRHIAFPLRGDPSDEETIARIETRANSVREAILSGASFAESAQTFSGNPETASQGGEIGWLAREELASPELAEYIFSLPVGDLSRLYREGDYGYHLFQVLEERRARPFDEVRAELERELREAPPSDDEIMDLEADLRRRIPVRVRQELLAPRS